MVMIVKSICVNLLFSTCRSLMLIHASFRQLSATEQSQARKQLSQKLHKTGWLDCSFSKDIPHLQRRLTGV